MPRRAKGRVRKGVYIYRPYDPKYHPQYLIDLMAKGYTNSQVWAEWNISEPTFYRWRKEYPELEEAYQVGKPKFETYWLENLMKPMAEGKLEGKHSFAATAYIMDVKSKSGAKSENGTTININNLAISHDNTTSQLIEKIQDNLKFLTDHNVLDVEYKVIEDDSKSNE